MKEMICFEKNVWPFPQFISFLNDFKPEKLNRLIKVALSACLTLENDSAIVEYYGQLCNIFPIFNGKNSVGDQLCLEHFLCRSTLNALYEDIVPVNRTLNVSFIKYFINNSYCEYQLAIYNICSLFF